MHLTRLLALLLALTVSPALAQWQVPNHAVPLGRGAGVTGFNSSAAGAAGTVFTGQGTSADPFFVALSSVMDTLLNGTVRGSVLYRNATSWVTLGPGTSGQLLKTNGAGADPAWVTASGTGTVTSVACGTGLDGGTFTTTGTCSLSAARRTLPTVQSFTTATSNQTYTTPANVLWIEVWTTAGGGGGAGASTDGGNGGASCFGTNATACTTPLLQATGGSGSLTAGAPGGTCTGGSLTPIFPMAGGNGSSAAGATGNPGANGGASFYGTGGIGIRGGQTGNGGNGVAIGSGGGGAAGGGNPFSSGAAGGTCYMIINSPAASYFYTVGAAGTAGTGAQTGGAGIAGGIKVIEHYN